MKLNKKSVISLSLTATFVLIILAVYSLGTGCKVESSSEDMLRHTCGSNVFYTQK